MKISDIKDKKITIMGLGLHGGGIGTIRFLSAAGAKITVTDMKSKEELVASIDKLKDIKNINYVFSQHRPEDFQKVDMVIKNPAVKWNNKYIKMAIEAKVPVEMDSSLFFKFCKNPIIGITGTKGKTTTSSLIFEILKLAGKMPIKVGIGQTSVLDKLEKLEKDSIVIFELSSWRLSALGRAKLSPHVAVLTNIYPDHLNYYKDMDAYVRDKKYIFLNQKKNDWTIINHDNEILASIAPEIKAQTIGFSSERIENGKSVFIDGDLIYYRDGIDEKKVIDLAAIKILGEHNQMNILAAIGAAKAYGIENATIKKAVENFSGVPHRLELVRILDGVRYINDTAATTPEAGIAGLQAIKDNIILIAGGADKNLDMEGFARVIIERSKGVVFLAGEATNKIISAMKKVDPTLTDKSFKIVSSMEKAVELASREAEKGDAVLLSPGSASFGLFLNEFDRGDKFKDVVNKLK
jgi:UDP-N-acetylmuramoylalanine--D-glutamate ligase